MGVDIQGKLRVALGSVKDHASIGKALIMYHHQQDGFSSIEIAVLRATGHDNNGTIEDKYMHEILFLVSNSPGSIPFLAEKISRRLNKTKDRLVALKTLVLIHRLLRGGNRRFEQELCKSHVSGHLQMNIRCNNTSSSSYSSFSSSDHNPCDCFLHKYSSYLEERMEWLINQAGKLEPIMSKGLEFKRYDEKSIDMVFRTLPKCQVLIDKILDCSPVGDFSAYDGLAQTAMSNTLRESFQVYKTFSEGVSALVNMLFDLTASARGLACEILKKASKQSQKLHELYQNCKKIVMNKNLEYPCVHIISKDHIMALDRCLGSGISKPPLLDPILEHLRRSTELEIMAVTTEKERRKKKANNKEDKNKIDHINLSSTLFSWTVLETKISKVWVVFEDEAPINESSSSPQVKIPAVGQSKFGDRIIKSEFSSGSCVFLNPFSSSAIDTVPLL